MSRHFSITMLLSPIGPLLHTECNQLPSLYSSSSVFTDARPRLPQLHIAGKWKEILDTCIERQKTAHIWKKGSPRNGQAALHLFKKHLLCWQYIHSFSACGRFWNGQKTPGGVRAVPVFIRLPPQPRANYHHVTIVTVLLIKIRLCSDNSGPTAHQYVLEKTKISCPCWKSSPVMSSP